MAYRRFRSYYSSGAALNLHQLPLYNIISFIQFYLLYNNYRFVSTFIFLPEIHAGEK